MKWLFFAIFIFAFAQQPTKDAKGTAKTSPTEITEQSNGAKQNKKQSANGLAVPNQTIFYNQQSAAPESKTDEAEAEQNAQIQRRIAAFTRLLVFVGVLQFFALVGQVMIYRRQAKIMAHQAHEMTRQRVTMHRQLEAMQGQLAQMESSGKQTEQIIKRMEDTAEKELRAYVCIGGAEIGFVQERAPVINVEIKNFGKTPAYNVQMWIGAAFGACPIPANVRLQPKPDSVRMSTSTMAPRGKPYTLPFQHPIIPEFAMSILGTPELTMYIYGEIKYVDAFKKERHTNYRLMFGGTTRQMLTVNKFGVRVANLRTAEDGNDAD